jgi:hypothetical protein
MANIFDNMEVFFSPLKEQQPDTCFWNKDDNEPYGEGWYYWFSFPGCLPESDPSGPYKTRQEAIDAIKKENSYYRRFDEEGNILEGL